MDLANLEGIMNSLSTFSAHDEVLNIVENNGDNLTDLMRQQLIEGIDIKGDERVDSYAPSTIKAKDKLGVPPGSITDHVTFYMTGELSESLFFSTLNNDEFVITSPLETYGIMLDRITPEEYGLSPENRLQFANEVVLPKFSKVFKEKTTLVLI